MYVSERPRRPACPAFRLVFASLASLVWSDGDGFAHDTGVSLGFHRTKAVKARLELAVSAAKSRRQPLGHVLLVGPPGSGKATLAGLIAKALGSPIQATSGPDVAVAGDLAGLLTSLEENYVLLLEDMHHPARLC
jgi:hypothetical protein